MDADEALHAIIANAPDEFFEAAPDVGDGDPEEDYDEPVRSGDDEPKPAPAAAEPLPRPTTTPAPSAAPKTSSGAAKQAMDKLAGMLTEKCGLYANSDRPIELDEYQIQAVEAAMVGKNMLITGSAGSGKSEVLREINRRSIAAGEVVNNVAHYGIAAANINGMTIHAFAALGMQHRPPYSTKNKDARARILSTKRLIIDEISTVSNHMLDGLDLLFRQVTGRIGEPFGGIQIIACGDFAQLAPIDDSKKRNEQRKTMKQRGDEYVDKSEELYHNLPQHLRDVLSNPSEPVSFVWRSKSWAYLKDNIYLLRKPHRQAADPEFLSLL